MTKETPPRDDENLVMEQVEIFEDTRERSRTATDEAKVAEIFERAAESNTKITKDNGEEINKLKESITERLINKALAEKPDGTEPFEDERAPEEKQQPAKKVTGLKKLAMLLGFGLAGFAGQAKGHDKNPEDSASAKPKNEKTIRVENSVEKKVVLEHDWNDYVDWLDGLGLKGSESLDHNDLGGAMIDRYKKEHPGTSVSRENIAAIQAEFIKYRDWVIGEIEAGRGQFRSKADEENFMKQLSDIDRWAGSKTTLHKFPHEFIVWLTTKTVDYNAVANKALKNPDAKMTNIMKDEVKVTEVKDLGFAKRGTEAGGHDNVAAK